MATHAIDVVIPEDHRLTIEVPAEVRSGPARLIFVVPSAASDEAAATAPSNRGRLATLAAELARDSRPFRELSPEERRARLHRLRGAGRGLTSGSDGFARRKAEEIELEERKLGR